MTTFTFIGLADSYFGMILDCDITSAVCCYLQVFHGDLCCFVATSIRHNLCFFGALFKNFTFASWVGLGIGHGVGHGAPH